MKLLKFILPFLLFTLFVNSTFATVSHEGKVLREISYSARKLVFNKAEDIKGNIGILEKWKATFTKDKIDNATDVNSEIAKIGHSKPLYIPATKVAVLPKFVSNAGYVSIAQGAVRGWVERVYSAAREYGLSKADEIKDLTKVAKTSAGKNADLITKNIDDYAEAARLGAGPKLPNNHISNFKNGKYYNRKLSQDEYFYRYHGVDNRTGKDFVYIMKSEYVNEKALRDGVALLDEWGVKITSKSKVKVPKDTWVSEGLADSQKGLMTSEFRKGGDYQALLELPDIPKSWIINTTEAFK